ncbi:MAG TPA: FKBP-type peptidyl-prolyl cis-trans isomerase [Puia sp.]|nr:FKBP-type peptidyl-prolyl cis-trans isomerase [Puia sp.]
MTISCGKASDQGSVSCTSVDPTADSSALLSFARTNGITAVKDTTGLYYQVITQGTGAVPNGNSVIYVTYTGTLLNGTIFDSTTNSAKTGFKLSNLIAGWQIGMPKIQAGGHIKLLIPSAYGYGCLGSGSIPANTPIYFDVTLVSVQ